MVHPKSTSRWLHSFSFVTDRQCLVVDPTTMAGLEIEVTVLGVAGVTSGEDRLKLLEVPEDQNRKRLFRRGSHPQNLPTKAIVGVSQEKSNTIFTTTGFSEELVHESPGSVLPSSQLKGDDEKVGTKKDVDDINGAQRFTAIWQHQQNDRLTGLGASVAFDAKENEEKSIKFVVALGKTKGESTCFSAYPIGDCEFKVDTTSDAKQQIVDVPLRFRESNDVSPFKVYPVKASNSLKRSQSLSRMLSMRTRSKSKSSTSHFSESRGNLEVSSKATLDHLKGVPVEQGIIRLHIRMCKKEKNVEVTLEQMKETFTIREDAVLQSRTSRSFLSHKILLRGAFRSLQRKEAKKLPARQQRTDKKDLKGMISDDKLHNDDEDNFYVPRKLDNNKYARSLDRRSWLARKVSSFGPNTARKNSGNKCLLSSASAKGYDINIIDMGISSTQDQTDEDSITKFIKTNPNHGSPARSTSTKSTEDSIIEDLHTMKYSSSCSNYVFPDDEVLANQTLVRPKSVRFMTEDIVTTIDAPLKDTLPTSKKREAKQLLTGEGNEERWSLEDEDEIHHLVPPPVIKSRGRRSPTELPFDDNSQDSDDMYSVDEDNSLDIDTLDFSDMLGCPFFTIDNEGTISCGNQCTVE